MSRVDNSMATLNYYHRELKKTDVTAVLHLETKPGDDIVLGLL